MLAGRLHAPTEGVRLEQIPLPEPSGDEVRIRVAGCGVCRTDLHIIDGVQQRISLPLTLGHEVAGWIDVAASRGTLEAAGLELGQPVIVAGGWGCGSCAQCAAGAEQRCAQGASPGFQRDGGYAEAMLVPNVRHLVAIGDVDPVRAAPLADAGLTTFRAVRRARRWLGAGARIAVFGCGGLGQFALQYLRLLGGEHARVVAVDPVDGRRVRALTLGADEALAMADRSSLHAALGGPADLVLDLVGADDTLATAAAVVAPDGLIMLVGEAGGALAAGFDRLPLEAWFTTTSWGSREDLADVVGLAAAGRLRWEVEPIPLSDVDGALERVRAADAAGRIVLVPPG
jgi:propanol-preferring alcohol dehydrogenase